MISHISEANNPVTIQQEVQPTQILNSRHASGNAEPGCQFFNPAKKRLCNWPCKPGHNYCGNHLFHATGEGEKRIPCPANPNHHVPVSQLKSHLRKCPDAVLAAAARAQPYFCENVNTGAVDSQQALQQLYSKLQQQQQQHSCNSAAGFLQDSEAARIAAEACASFLKGTAEQRQAAAIQAGPAWFVSLIQKIEAAHAALSVAHPLQRRLLGCCDGDPEALFKFSRKLDPLMPFDAKHAAQHASIIGNMQAAGLLRDPTQRIFVELGAGKGFLTAWLHQVCGAQDLVLLDRQGNFTKKADRRLRHTRLTRVAVDLKDAALNPLLQLHINGCVPKDQTQKPLPKPAAAAAAAANKAQAGSNSNRNSGHSAAVEKQQGCSHSSSSGSSAVAAADRDSRLVNRSHGGLICCPNASRTASTAAEPDAVKDVDQAAVPQQQQQQHVPWVVHGKHLCGAATDFALRACYNAAAVVQPSSSATQSQAAATAHDSYATSDTSSGSSTQFVLQGLAVATCCHHRCGWTAYCGQDCLQQYGISQQEFEVMAWLTSWALCGHEAPPGTAEAAEGSSPTGQHSPTQHNSSSNDNTSQQRGTLDPSASTSAAAAADVGTLSDIAAAAAAAILSAAGGGREQQKQLDYHPADLLSRDQRIVLGMKCKQLIDVGRCCWIQSKLLPVMQQQRLLGQQQLQQQQQQDAGGLCVSRVAYIDQSVTGENTLLLVGEI